MEVTEAPSVHRVTELVCQFYLMDEPVSHLDEENNRLVAELVYEEAKKQGAAIISTSKWLTGSSIR